MEFGSGTRVEKMSLTPALGVRGWSFLRIPGASTKDGQEGCAITTTHHTATIGVFAVASEHRSLAYMPRPEVIVDRHVPETRANTTASEKCPLALLLGKSPGFNVGK